jgi:anti-sigma-K factor RskA
MELEEKLALYALGALEPAEAAEFEAAMAASPALRRQAAEERALIGALAFWPEPVSPSAAVTRRLMTQIDAAATPLQKRLDDAAKLRPAPAPLEPSGFAKLLRGLMFGLGAVGALALVLLSINTVQVQNQLSAAQNELKQTRAQLEQARGEVDAQRSTLDEQEARIDALTKSGTDLDAQLRKVQTALNDARSQLDTVRSDANRNQDAIKLAEQQLAAAQRELAIIMQPDVRSVSLPAYNYSDGGAVTLLYSPKAKTGLVTVANLPKLSNNRDYQLWLIKGDDRLPSVVIPIDASGNGRAIVPSELAFGEYELFGITVEKTGGSPTPNPDGPIFLGKPS